MKQFNRLIALTAATQTGQGPPFADEGDSSCRNLLDWNWEGTSSTGWVSSAPSAMHSPRMQFTNLWVRLRCGDPKPSACMPEVDTAHEKLLLSGVNFAKWYVMVNEGLGRSNESIGAGVLHRNKPDAPEACRRDGPGGVEARTVLTQTR
ncbi:hypothetical protein RUM43_001902 [Polyplax serrata]|uniref:Uncharacterized protein n=1 Tax=Polyplax serrata TaxID=468196 RepID=A0AAN8SIP5_POLSC